MMTLIFKIFTVHYDIQAKPMRLPQG